MRLYYDPASTTSRPVTHFAADAGLDLELVYVSLANGEHHGDAFRRLNPNAQVPVLEDDGFILTECSAILKHLAEAAGSPAYPTERRARARVNERMDWFNTGFYRDAAYGLAYPALMPHLRAATPEQQAAASHRARMATARWLEILDRDLLGDRPFACGDAITLADYLGGSYVSLLEVVDYDFAAHPNVRRWLDRLRQQTRWEETYAAFDGLLSALRAPQAATPAR